MRKAIVIVTLTVLAAILMLGVSSTGVTVASSWVSNSLVMTNYHGYGTGVHYSNCANGACGPSAGVSTGRYYRDEKGYSYLSYDDDMYDDLYEEIPTFWCYTDPYYYGYGFVEMTIDPDQNNGTNDGYYNFGYVFDNAVTNVDNDYDTFPDDYEVIMDAIDNGWAIALDGNFMYVGCESKDGPGTWPPTVGHWIAIKGYRYYDAGYYTSNHQIICTDSYSWSDNLVLDWDNLVEHGLGLCTVIIKDQIPENFEWGATGVSLDTPGGNVAWTVSAGGTCSAKISTVAHYSTKSARFYRDGAYNIQASYSEVQPIWRGFWLRKNSEAVFYTGTGDGSHCILVRVLDYASGGKLQYYYNGAWRNTSYSLTSSSKWIFIEFRAIKWTSTFKYDIYVDGNYVKGGTPMYVSSGYDGVTAYYSESGYGYFYIDDISSSWW